jgi:hypothetical protein
MLVTHDPERTQRARCSRRPALPGFEIGVKRGVREPGRLHDLGNGGPGEAEAAPIGA